MRHPDCPVCARVGGPLVECSTCGLKKGPYGRSVAPAMAGGMCGHDCPGYYLSPLPDELWPGEVYGESMGHMGWHEIYSTPAPKEAP